VHTIVATLPTGNPPGIELADEVSYVDITDVVGVLEVARRLDLDGAATSCADTGLPALGAVCEDLGLPGLTRDSAEACADKRKLKSRFVASGVDTPAYRLVYSLPELDAVLDELGTPVIVKAPDLQGSRGIAIVRERSQAAWAFSHAIRATRQPEIVVEQFVVGREFGAQALVCNHKVVFVLVHNDEVHQGDSGVPIGHSVPFRGSVELAAAARAEVEAAIRAIGLNNCAVNVDLIVSDDSVNVLEVTGRVGANGLPEMVSAYFGIDYYETIVRLALGQPIDDWPRPAGPAVAVGMIVPPSVRGTLVRLDLEERHANVAHQFFVSPGARIDGFRDSNDCIGQIVATGDFLDDALGLVEAARAAVIAEVTPDQLPL
jgi:biotin carboxylase